MQSDLWVDKNDSYCESLREKAAFNTGSVSRDSCLYLRELTEKYSPRIIVELGTFIGKSTLAMKGGHIYTCDMSNDCLPSTDKITTYPGVTSTKFFHDLWINKKLLVDFFFFDGRIQMFDLTLILSMSHENTVYAFDDYDMIERYEKGVINVRLMAPLLPWHKLIPPPVDRDTTIAVLAPTY
jgi:hypothetical protein